ncbi:polysaccharide lyase family 7 protein [Echinimonas agarilytica]|nr:polysaccharide lyase family 7 protein [Echinimonas agarilytica]
MIAMLGLTSLFAAHADAKAPAKKFNLSHWKITLPMDADNNGKVDEVDVKKIRRYSHPDFFFLDEQGYMVFAAPNKATTTSGSSNTRSELRQMIRGTNTKIKTKSPKNNFAIAAHPNATSFGDIGGKLTATLKVDHVALNAGHPDKNPAYSVVVGQIHAGKDQRLIDEGNGFGWGNEPIKIYYKKWPDHDTGSVFWNYERNLPKTDPNRTDIALPVWGNTWENPDDPKDQGIALGEEFSYIINVHENVMYLTFYSAKLGVVNYEIDLSTAADDNDHPQGYAGDWFYFKAGAYNQCSTKDDEGGWYTACPGTGDWNTDKANGDYTQVSFSRVVLSSSEAPK